MENIDNILRRVTDPVKGTVRAAAFIAVNNAGKQIRSQPAIPSS